jgi:hypothetical protein
MENLVEGIKTGIETDDLVTPFDHIALAFSGGGFRAAAFSLGTLSYLNKLMLEDGETPLIQNVTYMSSASGGTIAAAMYALYKAEDKDFGEFYKALAENLEGDKLLSRVFRILNDDTNWKDTSKTRNMINAFAIAYDDLLFNGKTVATLRQAKSHLEEVCFNTTEFYRGLLFRQAIKMKPDSRADKDFLYGNFIINLNHPAAGTLKLGDLLAASSCFPAGFEPIIFPVDFGTPATLLSQLNIQFQEVSLEELRFLYDEQDIQAVINALPPDATVDTIIKALRQKPFRKDLKIGFMDGGIADNQGIESMIKANGRRLDNKTSFKPFDFMLINDVGSHYMDPYELPKVKDMRPFFKKLTFRVLFNIALAILALSTGGIVWSFLSGNGSLPKTVLLISTVLLVVSSIIVFPLMFVNRMLQGKIRKEKGLNLGKNFSEGVIKKLLLFFRSTPIEVIATMIKQRFNSVLTLNNDVFLKRVRQLLYKEVFDEVRTTSRVKTNHVYDLSFTNDLNFKNNNYFPAAGRNLQIVAELSYCMGTTLWFDEHSAKEYTLPALISCGQFTTCYNLLQYTQRLIGNKKIYKNFSVKHKDRLKTLEQQLTNDLGQFQNDPFWLYNKYGVETGIANFTPCNMSMFPFPDGNFKGLR